MAAWPTPKAPCEPTWLRVQGEGSVFLLLGLGTWQRPSTVAESRARRVQTE